MSKLNKLNSSESLSDYDVDDVEMDEQNISENNSNSNDDLCYEHFERLLQKQQRKQLEMNSNIKSNLNRCGDGGEVRGGDDDNDGGGTPLSLELAQLLTKSIDGTNTSLRMGDSLITGSDYPIFGITKNIETLENTSLMSTSTNLNLINTNHTNNYIQSPELFLRRNDEEIELENVSDVDDDMKLLISTSYDNDQKFRNSNNLRSEQPQQSLYYNELLDDEEEACCSHSNYDKGIVNANQMTSAANTYHNGDDDHGNNHSGVNSNETIFETQSNEVPPTSSTNSNHILNYLEPNTSYHSVYGYDNEQLMFEGINLVEKNLN